MVICLAHRLLSFNAGKLSLHRSVEASSGTLGRGKPCNRKKNLGLVAGTTVNITTLKGEACFILKIVEMCDDVVSVEYGWWYPERKAAEPDPGDRFRQSAFAQKLLNQIAGTIFAALARNFNMKEYPMNFNHFDEQGHAVMVDVSSKQETIRTATAAADVVMSAALLDAIAQKNISKGDVLGVARLAGIMAAKKTDDLIPLSHPLSLHSVAIEFEQDPAKCRMQVRCTVRAFERTGVEMEAMTGAAVAALTIYDMCKGTDKSVSIANIRLLFKEGGKSGLYRREETV